MKILPITLAVLLVACAGDPPPVVPPLRTSAENAHRAAISAARALRWENAIAAWQEALVGYQAVDDWTGQGRARLGLAQAYVRDAKPVQANQVLVGMTEQTLYPASLRAQAAYQQALLVDAAGALVWLDKSRQLCVADCAIGPQLDNLAARLALGRGDHATAAQAANRALANASQLPAERSHARRLLAELALAQNAAPQAKIHLDEALKIDRQLAEPDWLLDDYRLLARIAAALDDAALVREAKTRLASLCQAAGLTACP